MATHFVQHNVSFKIFLYFILVTLRSICLLRHELWLIHIWLSLEFCSASKLNKIQNRANCGPVKAHAKTLMLSASGGNWILPLKCCFRISYGIGRKCPLIWVSVLVSDLNQNSGSSCTLNWGRTFLGLKLILNRKVLNANIVQAKASGYQL